MEIEAFIEDLAGLSDNTRRNYENTLWQLRTWIAGDEPTDDEVQSFLKRYDNSSSLHRNKAAIKAYYDYMKRLWPFNRRQFALPKRGLPRYVAPGTVRTIADSGDHDDYMFVWTLFQLGCRIRELMGIKKSDITPQGVRLYTKGGFFNLRPLTKEFLKELSEYAKDKKDLVFPGTYAFYRKRLSDLAKSAGSSAPIGPHMLRHARAVDLLNKGMPLPFVQQFLGHANINTTAIYLQITGGELNEQLQKVESGDVVVQNIIERLSEKQKEQLREALSQ